MKLKVVVDAKNRILAVAQLPEVKPGEEPRLMARPVAGPGQREFDVAIPVEHADKHLRTIMRGLHVNSASVVEYRVPKSAVQD
jgi:hypothetical protein